MRGKRGNPVKVRCCPLGGAGRPTVRGAGFRGGNRTPKKRTPVAERQRERGSDGAGPPTGCFPYNRPDTGPGARPRKRADVRRVSRDDECRSSPEPRDTLDALEVNRTEDAVQQMYQDSVRRDRYVCVMACLSRVPRRVACTVLRGRRRSNASSLPDRSAIRIRRRPHATERD
jgi:hypothetical protein